MSESPKMGLFGSKGKTEDLKKESTKEDSPDRYEPYCMDNTTEAYDTEALSIMDINDIIGVQSEPMADSTLESEIAALSEIITDSKNETTHNPMEVSTISEAKDSSREEKDSVDTSILGNKTSINDELLEEISGQYEELCNSQEIHKVNDIGMERPGNNKTEPDKVAAVSDKLKDNCSIASDINNPNVPSAADSNPILGDTIAQANLSNLAVDPQKSDSNRETDKLAEISSLGGSLKLIGEAYTSEDSQEASSNDADRKEDDRSASFGEKLATLEESPVKAMVRHTPGDSQEESELFRTDMSKDDSGPMKQVSNEAEGEREVLQAKSNISIAIDQESKPDVPTEDTEEDRDSTATVEDKLALERMEVEISKEQLELPIEVDSVESLECELDSIEESILKNCQTNTGAFKLEEGERSMSEKSLTNIKGNQSSLMGNNMNVSITTKHQANELKGVVDSSDSTYETVEGHCNLRDQLCRDEKAQFLVSPIGSLAMVSEKLKMPCKSDSCTSDENVLSDQNAALTTLHTVIEKIVCPQASSENEKENNNLSDALDIPNQVSEEEKSDAKEHSMELNKEPTECVTLENQGNSTGNIETEDKDMAVGNVALAALDTMSPKMTLNPVDRVSSEGDGETIQQATVQEAKELQTPISTSDDTETPSSLLSTIQKSSLDMETKVDQAIMTKECQEDTLDGERVDDLEEEDNILKTRRSEDQNVITEDLEEETIEEEMNLTFELEEETEPQTDIVICNVEEALEAEKVKLSPSRATSEKNQKNVAVTEQSEEPGTYPVEDMKSAIGVNEESGELIVGQGIQKTSTDAIVGETQGQSGSCVDEALPSEVNVLSIAIESKDELADEKSNSASEETAANKESDDDLLTIRETTGIAPELLSEEKCQHPPTVADSIIVNEENSVAVLKNILVNDSESADEIQEIPSRPLAASCSGDAEVGGSLDMKVPKAFAEMSDKPMGKAPAMEDSDATKGLIGMDVVGEKQDSLSKLTNVEGPREEESLKNKNVDTDQLEQRREHSIEMEEERKNVISDVIGSCLSSANDTIVGEDSEEERSIQQVDKNAHSNGGGKSVDEPGAETNVVAETGDRGGEIGEIDEIEVVKDLQAKPEAAGQMELEIEFTEAAEVGAEDDLEDSHCKMALAADVLLESEEQTETSNDIPPDAETSQPSSEISELESAVKFLQESEEHALDSPLILSPKTIENDATDASSKQTDASSLFVPDADVGEDTSDLAVELQDIATDSISISEAEIISEAAKLENERKLAEQIKINSAPVAELEPENIGGDTNAEKAKTLIPEVKEALGGGAKMFQPAQSGPARNAMNEPVVPILAPLSQRVLKPSENIPKVSILEERLKEPPKIEIPTCDVTKLAMSPTATKDSSSLLIQKDSKMMGYQKMLESPKAYEKAEPKITDTPRKDSADKHEFESVGSPRIILKIAKSAIAECTEPRSPKSPKIRSATNSPNPEDSPGQKLGKIKLKLSKGGHPSIISNENIEDAIMPWHSDGAASLSPIGMKIKFSKSGDASIICTEKHEGSEEMKRTESPIGMKIKLSKSGDASIIQEPKDVAKHKEKLDMMQGSPKRTESPIGMKIKLSRSGDASIIQPERQEHVFEEQKDGTSRAKESSYNSPKRTDSPIGMKIKLSKSGDASIVSQSDGNDDFKEASTIKEKNADFSSEIPKRNESPIGMKIKLAKTKGGASIISLENTEEAKEKSDLPEIPRRTESPLGMKIKLSKTGDASIIHTEMLIPEDSKADSRERFDVAQDLRVQKLTDGSQAEPELAATTEPPVHHEVALKGESPIGMKIKLSKSGDASIVPSSEKQEQLEEQNEKQKCREQPLQDLPKRTESPLGMKIKLSKSGDASIIQSDVPEEAATRGMRAATAAEQDRSRTPDSSLGCMKIKLLKSGDASIVDSAEKKEKSQQRRRDSESPLEMKIKLSKTGHPTIVPCDTHGEAIYKAKDVLESAQSFSHRYKESMMHKEPALKILKTAHSAILHSNRSELTIEPIQVQSKKADTAAIEISPKRKEVTISPIEPKKSKLETQLSQILPEVTIQPVISRDQKQLVFDPKTSLISRQQMSVISQEISITQVRSSKTAEGNVSEKLKQILKKNLTDSPLGSDCEIIEHRPELIIVNENSNSSQDVVIIEEVPPLKSPDLKASKRRGRPRRGGGGGLAASSQLLAHTSSQVLMTNDQIVMEEVAQPAPQVEHRENERPKRTCRSQKSYAPPKRGRGRGRGKRKLDGVDGSPAAKKVKLEQDLSAIESSTMALITLDGRSAHQDSLEHSELYKALQQPPVEGKLDKQSSAITTDLKTADASGGVTETLRLEDSVNLAEFNSSKAMPKPPPSTWDGKDKDKKVDNILEKGGKASTKPGHGNWVTPPTKKPNETGGRPENVSTVQVIDEETRMSAESNSRSQTPARNMSVPASDNIINEESQGSVLSTATTESEKVKVKNRRMEINFDPDEGPFTVDKIAEYEWPLDRKGETFMIQEQISQYLGVKSFKRKYPDLKRRMVDMEERNYLRENCLVSEAMCDMGLTAVCSSEVLDVMCSDFPDQYEEYRKHMREKQVKEHSKKQKELTAAANAEKNRIDLAEMAVQSALSWNMNLNKARKETRKCSLDLQTFTIHVPKKQQKVDSERKVSHYPVALIPGQYTDYYREYTAAELRYYPLNTVLYGPMRPNERKFDSQSEGSQSDSDSDSSSDDSSSSSSEGTQDTEGSQSTMDDVDIEIVNQKDDIKLKCKMCLKSLNKNSKNELLIQCGTCNGHVHPSCIDLTLDMVPHIQSYAWQCTDCKTCAQCHDPADEDKMLFCDMCDRGYHIYCVGLRRVPQGRWHCQECAVCASCGSREAGGLNSDRNSVAQWQHEYKKGDKNTRVYVSTLCVPCSKLWRKGRYCPHCSRCHTAPRLDLEANLVHCSACDKYLHLGCVEIKGQVLDRKNYLCDFCIPNRQHVMKPLVSKNQK